MGYQQCSNECGNLVTDRYADQYQTCATCHIPTDVKLYRVFGRNHQ